MKRFWIISTLAVLAAMIFGSMLHRWGQEGSAMSTGLSAKKPVSRLPSFVADSQLEEQEAEMPFEFPLMPELLPEVRSDLPAVNFSSRSSRAAEESSPVEKGAAVGHSNVTPVKMTRHVSTVVLSKNGISEVEAAAVPEKVSSGAVINTGRFLPIVLHIGSEGGKLILQGSIPTRENTEAVYAAAVRVAGEDSVENYLKYSPDTLEADWVNYLPEYIETFFAHTAGSQELIVVDGILKLRGDVASENSKEGLVALADSIKEGGLEIDQGLTVREALAGELPELSGSYATLADAAASAGSQPEESIDLALLEKAGKLNTADEAQTRSASTPVDKFERGHDAKTNPEPEIVSEPESKPDSEPVGKTAPMVEVAESGAVEETGAPPGFVGPAVSAQDWAAGIKTAKDDLAAAEAVKRAAKKAEKVAAVEAKTEKEAAAKMKAEREAIALAAAERAKAGKEAEDAAVKAAKLEAMLASGERIPDDGKPLIFYFETNSSEIVSSDREKIARAIQRAQIPRSIVYITAYADYRGGYELNRKLSLERAEKVRELIFAGDVAAEVTAEITAKGDSQSVKQDLGKRETDEALKRSRRVVVEVYHLK